MSMKTLSAKTLTKKVDFMGEKVEIRKMSYTQVKEVQALVVTQNEKVAAGASDDDAVSLLADILRIAVVGADELTAEEFENFPIIEMSELSEKVMEYSGLASQGAANDAVGN